MNMTQLIMILAAIIGGQVFVLGIIIFIIKRLLVNDTMQAVSRIRQVEAEVRRKEEGIRKEIEEHEKEFAKKKVEAEQELQRQRETSEKELARMREGIIADARKEADSIMDMAKRNEEKLRKQVMQDMEEKAVDYGAQVFKMVFSEKMNEVLNKQFIDELLDAVEQIDASSITVDSNSAEFTSSHPILPEQKERIEKLLDEKFGAKVKVVEKVDSDLIAGLVFKLGSLEIDGSLVNRFQEAATEVKKGVAG